MGEKGVIGIMTPREAITMAREKQLDLVEVAPNADPPVCRMMDYGKFLYDKAKRERKARKASKSIEVKGVRLTTRTGEHDLEFKSRDARRFLEEGCKVKV
ncbi:MAG: translation initiation factor IF-3, partial [Anaerolineae bacterium]|nr:translation initiation factor IF-3 [Anaerolineae bacterium]